MSLNDSKEEVDEYSGVETTGHEWDGIKELNNPAPRWWVWVFLISCIWAVGYWFVYPAWPTFSGEGERGGTEGNIQWTQYRQLEEQQADIVARKSAYLTRFQESSFQDIIRDTALYKFSVAGGKSAFKDNCATCHGSGGAGAKGYPNLNDDDWLWGGSVDEIYQSIRYGIRSSHANTRMSQMPIFTNILTDEQVGDVSAYVVSLSQGAHLINKNGKIISKDGRFINEKGKVVFDMHCAFCHQTADGAGNTLLGAPNLTDSIWFYSEGDYSSVMSQIKTPQHGVMPSWENRLSRETIRQLAVYVHSLGGGE
jgi:cytochrome c oxidase cbb3-type subunit III